jgi:hypothetical protein
VEDGRDTPLMINSTSLDVVPFVVAKGAIVESGRRGTNIPMAILENLGSFEETLIVAMRSYGVGILRLFRSSAVDSGSLFLPIQYSPMK